MKLWELEREHDELIRFVLEGRERRRGDVRASVESIKKEVLAGGDGALLGFSRRWDAWGRDFPLKVGPDEIEAAAALVDKRDVAVLKGMIANVKSYHKGQKPARRTYKKSGLAVREEFVPLERAMVYVPGGTAPYPSSLVMGAVPAKIAGVKEIFVATPAKDGAVNPYILACCKLLGIGEVFRVGGAQAIYAFSFGTETVPKVDIIVGPGNAFVEEAKRDVYGRVGIDMLAGPTELIILCNEPCPPKYMAWDIFSQAEHDEMATIGFFCRDREMLGAVQACIDALMETNPRRDIIAKALQNSFFVHYEDIEAATRAIDRIAPEHMEIIGRERTEKKLSYPGVIYLGKYTPVAMGDYYIGTNHVLPTGGAGRFTGGLSVNTFLRRKVVVKLEKKFLEAHGDNAMRIASIEGLYAHGEAIRIRKES